MIITNEGGGYSKSFGRAAEVPEKVREAAERVREATEMASKVTKKCKCNEHTKEKSSFARFY